MTSKEDENINIGEPVVPGLENSIFLQTWQLLSTVREEKSNTAIQGSTANLVDVLTDGEEEAYYKACRAAQRNRTKSESDRKLLNTLNMQPIVKNCSSGVNCVIQESNPMPENNTSRTPVLDPEYFANVTCNATFRNDSTDSYFQQLRANISKSYCTKAERDVRLYMNQYRNPLEEIANSGLIREDGDPEVGSPAKKFRRLTRRRNVSADSQLDKHELSEVQNILNRNSININLTVNLPPLHEANKTSVESSKSPYNKPEMQLNMSQGKTNSRSRCVSRRTEKAETSIQTEESTHEIHVKSGGKFDFESASQFPSVIPSQESVIDETSDEEGTRTVSCIPDSKRMAWNEFIDVDAVAAYSGKSIKNIVTTADEFIHNFVIMPDEDLYTEEEFKAGEEKVAISIMRLLGVPQKLRHDIYNEALHTIQAIKEISLETVSIINHIIDWLTDGDDGGREKLINRVRQIASVTTDFQPDSEGWTTFENDFSLFTDAVGLAMKQSYETGKEVAKRCSYTIIEQINRAKSQINLTALSTSQEEAEASSVLPAHEVAPSPLNETNAIGQSRNPFIEIDETLTEQAEQNIETEPIDRPITNTFINVIPENSGNLASTGVNSFCEALAVSIMRKANVALGNIHGTGKTPVLGESECASRNEPVDTKALFQALQKCKEQNNNEKDPNGNDNLESMDDPEIAKLQAELEKLAALTDSHFIQPNDPFITDSNEDEIATPPNHPEPTALLPPPPIPPRIQNFQDRNGNGLPVPTARSGYHSIRNRRNGNNDAHSLL